MTKAKKLLMYDQISDGRYYQAMIEDSPTPMLLTDQSGAFLDANKAASKFFGYSIDDLVTMRFQQVTHRDDMVASMEMINALMLGGTSQFDMVKRYITKTGIVWTTVRVTAIRGDENALEACVVHIVPLMGCSDDVMRDIVMRMSHGRMKYMSSQMSFVFGIITAIVLEVIYRLVGIA